MRALDRSIRSHSSPRIAPFSMRVWRAAGLLSARRGCPLYDMVEMITTVPVDVMSDARRPRIVLIDDDPSVRDTLQHLLASLGYECQTAADGVSGLALFDKGGCDLILLDVAMPGMSGWTVVETIRRRAPLQPIVLITGMHEPAVMRRASESRLPVLLKPFRFEVVQTAVATALQGRRV
jgi:CheY-like chemotaxis protein